MDLNINLPGVITFFSVCCLSYIIYMVKKSINKQKAAGSNKASGASASSNGNVDKTWSADGESTFITTGDTKWIIAAVAAYLEEESYVSAMAWIPSASEKQEPWVALPRVHKRLVRV